ncbi:interleukin-15 receptor subunit alpha isoform X2 [Anarrhichthys ocellatus]|uniref:interleukin-15 receptor subunit alpha isoform X2 n=1 Tax=Anarrhichthys ocellatus TaxID=433405 RepID=UPI0012EE513F|nr:interleukin-15 receptor subunit alpha isoform X2 [Anarrhichthys ocellatus]
MKSPQSSQMDLGSPFALFSVCVLTICLLGTARCSNDKIHCPCLEVPKRNLTLLATDTCFQINQTFRYKCKGGTVRKVGTSGLIKCTQTDNGTAHWVPSNISLKCIPDPSRTTTQPPESTATKAHTDIPHVSTIATTVTASSSPQMTQSLSPSASVPAEPDRPAPTSPGLQAPSGRTQAGKEQDVRKTKATHRTTVTSTTAEPSNNGAHDAHVFPPAAHTVIGCASVVIVCALIGIGFYCYRRRSNSDEPPQMPEESIPMNPSEH